MKLKILYTNCTKLIKKIKECLIVLKYVNAKNLSSLQAFCFIIKFFKHHGREKNKPHFSCPQSELPSCCLTKVDLVSRSSKLSSPA